MRSVHRTALGVVLAFAPVVGAGCITVSGPMRANTTSAVGNNTMNSARLAESRGNFPQAMQLYSLAHQQNPRNAECLHRMGVVSTLLNQNDRAEFYYREAYKLAPNNAELLADMGYSAFTRKDYEKSEAFLQQSYQLNNKDPRTITNLGIALAWRGKDEASLAMFRMVATDGESRQRLASIQSARNGNAPHQSNVQIATNTSDRQTIISESAVRTTSFSGTAPAIDLPRPLPTESRLELPVPTVEEKKPVEPISVPKLHTSIVIPATPIELPSPLPMESSFQPVELLEQPAPLQHNLNRDSSTTSPIEIPLLPVPPYDSVTEAEGESTTIQSGFTEESSPPIALQANEWHRNEEISAMLKTYVPNMWRKTQDHHETNVEADAFDVFQPVIQQMSAQFETTESKRPTHGICLVTLLEEMRPVPGKKHFEVEYQSQLYRFSSQEALEKFRLNPRKYAPAAGGVDVVSVRNHEESTLGTYNFAIRFQRRLYLFTSRQNAEEFRRDPAKYVAVE